MNNPVNLSDPSGLIAEGYCFSCGLGGGAGVGAYNVTSWCLTVAKDKNNNKEFGIIKSVSQSKIVSGYNVSADLGYMVDFNAEKLKDLVRKDTVSGASAKAIGGLSVEFTLDEQKQEVTGFSVGGGVGFGPEIHKGKSDTTILLDYNKFLKNNSIPL